MKKILITGGAGFIGYHLAKRLLRDNYQIDLLDNFDRGVKDSSLIELLKNKNVNFLNINLMDSKAYKSLQSDYEYIYHLAAIVGVQNVINSPSLVLINNFLLLNNALTISKNQNNLKRFIFASTSEVYAGTLKYFKIKFPTPEDTPLSVGELQEERTSYMLSKIYGEALCLQSGIPSTIIRPHNIYGPRMGLSHVIPELMQKIINSNNNELDVYSTDHKRTFCFIKDAVEMIKLLAESPKSIGDQYNVGNENEEITMNDLAALLMNILNKDLKIIPKPSTQGSPKRRIPSMKKFKKIISYENQFSIKKGIAETYSWYDKYIFSGKELSSK